MCLQDYVKWRGQLFHQFMRALVDDSHEVRSLANYLLADALSTKVCLRPSALLPCPCRTCSAACQSRCIPVDTHMASSMCPCFQLSRRKAPSCIVSRQLAGIQSHI